LSTLPPDYKYYFSELVGVGDSNKQYRAVDILVYRFLEPRSDSSGGWKYRSIFVEQSSKIIEANVVVCEYVSPKSNPF